VLILHINYLFLASKTIVMKFKFLLSAFSLMYLLSSCKNDSDTVVVKDTATIDGHPSWIMQGNIYEVNVRQYTPEGTFKAFEQHIDRLKEMGVQTLWFMPIHPISKLDRKGTLGSYYAVQSYVDVNPEFGTMEDWKSLVKKCHSLGMKVIIDWVPNHTGADHKWLTTNPDFYVLDSVTKKPISPFDWTDTRKLNYENLAFQDTMIAQMKFWITETDIDGFRCDVAGEVKNEFWKKCITALKKEKNIFMLAEGDKKGLHESGFDANYAWHDFAVLKQIANGSRNISSLDSAIAKADTLYPSNATRMFFTSNHDENTWNKADYATMPGAVHAPFAVLTQTMKQSVPLIYSGQEEPFLDSLSFFYKDTISFGKYERANFYKTLLTLRKNNAALSANASFKKVSVGDDKFVYAFVREKDKNKVLVILNLSANPQNILIKDAGLLGKAYNVFMGSSEELKNSNWQIEPWGYVVYEYK
jgi:glycosidase